jgi:hypothetical protein
MISKPTSARMCMKVYYTLHVSPTCFSQSYRHRQGRLLQRIRYIKILQTFFNQYTSVNYFMFHIFYILQIFYIRALVQELL